MNRIAISCLFTLCTLILSAQNFTPIQIPVASEESSYEYPFAGGAQAPQFSQVDLDFDGNLDMFVFDRSGDVISTYRNISNSYVYAPELADSFPVLREWAYLVDYNDDGVADLFTSPSMNVFNGIEVWIGRNDNGKIAFELKEFDQFVHDGLYFQFGVDYFNVYVPSDDFPSIVDMDSDGDLDVVSFGTGGSQLFYYENQVVEKGLPKDTFDFILADDCYGGIFESEVSQELFLSETMDGCAQGIKGEDEDNKGGIHAGSTLLSLDANNDGLFDLLIGDLANTHMTLAYNGGNPINTWFNEQDIRFPEYNETIEMPFFLGSFQIDYDFDGDQDLIATCNRTIGVVNTNNVWLYEKTSTTADEPYQIVKKNYLVEGMLDLGENSAPTFVDVNQDGLMDIVAGTSGEYLTVTLSNTSMTYLKNVGTLAQPEFVVEDTDWLNFSDFKEFSIGIVPTFGDLDSDGDLDLLVGERTGKLYYYENLAGEGNPMAFATPIPQYKNIDVGNYAKPVIVDMDGDGLNDLLIGEEGTNSDPDNEEIRSSLNYYKNIGSVGSPDFDNDPNADSNDRYIGQVIRTTPFQGKSGAAPYLVQSEDMFIMAVGSEAGAIALYSNIVGNLNSPFSLITDSLYNIHVGSKSTPALHDINNNGYLELLVGNERGGLNFFSTEILSMVSDTNEEVHPEQLVTIHPNPVNDILSIKTTVSWNTLTVFDISGRTVLRNAYSNELDLSNLTAGVYFLKLSSDEQQVVKKLVKH